MKNKHPPQDTAPLPLSNLFRSGEVHDPGSREEDGASDVEVDLHPEPVLRRLHLVMGDASRYLFPSGELAIPLLQRIQFLVKPLYTCKQNIDSPHIQVDHIGRFFLPIGLLLETHCDFL